MRKEKKIISQKRRELMLKVIDEYPPCIPIMHQMSRYVHCDSFLKFLLANKITGRNLFDFLKINFDNSILSMVQFIIKKTNKDREVKALYLGKDWVK